MRFLETPSLEYVNSLLDSVEFGDQAISGKLEAYSCAPLPLGGRPPARASARPPFPPRHAGRGGGRLTRARAPPGAQAR